MYENFARLLEQHGLTPYRVSKDTGISQSTLSDWKTGRSVPKREKLQLLAEHAFAGKYPAEEVRRVRELFFRRFFTQQFKRTAAPDGIQAGPFSLSARRGWEMGADITGALWRS